MISKITSESLDICLEGRIHYWQLHHMWAGVKASVVVGLRPNFELTSKHRCPDVLREAKVKKSEQISWIWKEQWRTSGSSWWISSFCGLCCTTVNPPSEEAWVSKETSTWLSGNRWRNCTICFWMVAPTWREVMGIANVLIYHPFRRHDACTDHKIKLTITYHCRMSYVSRLQGRIYHHPQMWVMEVEIWSPKKDANE